MFFVSNSFREDSRFLWLSRLAIASKNIQPSAQKY